MSTVAQQLDAAEHLLDLGRWQEAQPYVVGALASEPDSARGLCILARCHYQADDGASMLLVAESAVAVAPEYIYAHRLHASALAMVGRVADAVAVAEGAVRIDPASWSAHQLLAQLTLNLGTPTAPVRAYTAAKRAIDLAPEEPSGWITLGVVYSAVGARRRARQATTEALRLDPTNAIAQHNTALADLQLGRLVRASQGFSAAIGAEPDEMSARRHGRRTAERLLARWAWVGSLASVPAMIAYLSGAPQPVRSTIALIPLLLYGLGSAYLWRRVPAGIRSFARIGVRHGDLSCVIPVVSVVLHALLTLTLAVLPAALRESSAMGIVTTIWLVTLAIHLANVLWSLGTLFGGRVRRGAYWLAGIR